MTRYFNFGPGPGTLPEAVLHQAQAELLDWQGRGLSVMEMSHRGADFMAIAQQAEEDLRALLAIPENYKVLFLQGGATLQFAMVPLNLLRGKTGADYINTGSWSRKAIAEAQRFCEVNVAASSESTGFDRVPPAERWKLNADAAYCHYTPNETIGGVEFHDLPQVGDVPLVADMSSTILSRPLDVSRFGVIYAGAQKNMGPSGVTAVIVREDLIGHVRAGVPSLLDYRLHEKNGSMANTPCTFSWYLSGLVLRWLRDGGGLGAIEEINQRKAEKLYAAIDGSGGFYANRVERSSRSRMNVSFFLADEALNPVFLEQAAAAGLVQLKGHRSVGGMRASLYNAMPEAGVDALIDFMANFQTRYV